MSLEESSLTDESLLNEHTLKLLQSLSQRFSNGNCNNGCSGNGEVDEPNARPVLLLLRHAERREFAKEEGSVPQEPITERGEQASFELGKRLKQCGFSMVPPRSISSPFVRCRQTIEHILRGAEWKTDVEIKAELFGDGNVFYDHKLVKQEFMKIGCAKKIASRYASGEIIPGLHPISEAVAKMLELLVSELDRAEQEKKQLVLALSHDFNIATLAGYFFDVRLFDEKVWPGFLEAVAVAKSVDGDKLEIIWRERQILTSLLN